MNKPKTISLLVVCGLAWIISVSGCNLFDWNDTNNQGISLPAPAYPQAYAQPSVSPDGNKLLFVRNKITQIGSIGDYSVDPDSSGIWMAGSDGKNMKLLIQGLNGWSPSFSPDMQWILFESGAQIYKVPFAADSARMDELVQLTSAGRNFSPTWSPDGKWIVYDRSVEDETGPGGIWIMKSDGSQKEHVFGGGFPDWHPNGLSIAAVFGTSAWKRFKVYTINNGLTEILDAVVDANNLYPKYSPDGNQIIFQSEIQIWLMDSEGNNVRRLSEKGVEPSWYPDGKIIYVRFSYSDFNQDNGTLWIMDADGSGKKQLTFNYGLKLVRDYSSSDR